MFKFKGPTGRAIEKRFREEEEKKEKKESRGFFKRKKTRGSIGGFGKSISPRASGRRIKVKTGGFDL